MRQGWGDNGDRWQGGGGGKASKYGVKICRAGKGKRSNDMKDEQ